MRRLRRTSPDDDIDQACEETDPPEVLYNQGLANLNAGKTTEAARKFEAIDQQHPFSEYARKALVMKAFVNYRNGQYQDAINAASAISISIRNPKTPPMRSTLSALPIRSRSPR